MSIVDSRRQVSFPSCGKSLDQSGGSAYCGSRQIFSGKPSPTRAAHVLQDFDGKIPYIIDDGPCEVGVESTALDILSDPIRLFVPAS